MSFDAHKNFAYSTVATAPSPASSGTSLHVFTGDGSKFPAAPFNAVIWPTAANPLSTNAEIVRVTNVSTDTFTVTRAQESTSARTVVVGDQIMAAVTAKTLTDLETEALSNGTSFPGSPNDRDWFHRTDRDVTFFYHASLARWLSTDLKYVTFSGPGQLEGISSYGNALGRIPLYEDTYIEKWVTYTNVLTTNDGGNYYTLSLQNENASVASIDTAGDTVAVATVHTAVIGTLFSAGKCMQVATATVGSPGNHYVTSMLLLRSAA